MGERPPAGAALTGPRDQRVPGRGLSLLPRRPLACLPLLQQEPAWPLVLVAVRKSGEMRPSGAEDWPQLQFCSIYVGQKKQTKKQGWVHILFLFHVLCSNH